MTRASYIPVKGIKPNRGKQITVAEFRRMWHDPALTIGDIAERLGVCSRSVWQRAKYRGLPGRGHIVAKSKSVFDDEFAALYEARVFSADLARHYGCTVSNVEKHSRRLGVKRSRRMTRWDKGMTIEDYRALQLREAMAASARETLGHMACAEMLDDARRVLRRAA